MKKVLVTGGNRGIGLAIAEQLKLEDYEILSPSSKELDVSDEASIKKFFKKHFKEEDTLYALINNAGVFHESSLENYSTQDWKKVIDINLTGAFLVSREALKYLQNNQGGRIIMISSISARGYAYTSAYSASKAGLIGLANSLAEELAKDDIQVNTICPGWVRTDMAKNILHNEDLEKNNLSAALQKRWIEAEEIAQLVSYLLSTKSKAITGQSINIDAGLR